MTTEYKFETERAGNITKWKIVWNEHSSVYFIYRVVPNVNNLRKGKYPFVSEYLQRNGKIAATCAKGWFEDFNEIAATFTIHAYLIKNDDVSQLVEEGYYNFVKICNEKAAKEELERKMQ